MTLRTRPGPDGSMISIEVENTGTGIARRLSLEARRLQAVEAEARRLAEEN